MKIWGSIAELVSAKFRKNGKEIVVQPNNASYASVTSPVVELPPPDSGTVELVGRTSSQILENKTIDGDVNTLQDVGLGSLKTVLADADKALVRNASGVVTSAKILNVNVDPAAAIAYSKLNLATSIVNADIATGAAIVDTKLDTISTAGKVSGSAITSGTIGGSTVVNTSGNITTSGNLAGTLTSSGTSGLTSLGYATTTAASNTTVTPASDRPVIVITSVTSSSINAVANPANGKQVFLVNNSSSDLVINNDNGSPATSGIITGTGSTFTLKNGASVSLLYNTTMNRWTLSGGAGGSGAGTAIAALGGASGYPVGTPVYFSGSTVLPASANAANTAEVIGLVAAEPTSGNYTVLLLGAIEVVSTSAYDTGVASAAGTVLFLSPTAGKLTAVEPTVIGQVSVPLAVSSGGTGIVVSPKRGTVLGGANARTQLSLLNVTTAQNVQDVSAYSAGELTGWVQVSATSSKRFYLAAQFTKNMDSSDYTVSYQTSGDTPLTGFNVTVTTAGMIQVTLASSSVAGFVSASINYALNAPSVGATFPLAVDASTITTGVVAAARLPAATGTTAGTVPFYEEGTWTATVTNAANLTGTGTASGLTYTRIGNTVFCRINSITGQTTTVSGTTTTMTIAPTGLPGVTNNTQYYGTARCDSGGNTVVAGFVDNSGATTFLNLQWLAQSSAAALTVNTISFTYTI